MRKVWGGIDLHFSIPVVGSIIILLLTAAIGLFVGSRGITYREIMIFGALIVVGSAFILGDRGIRLGFICFIFMFGLGYRTIRFSSLVLPPSGVLRPERQNIQIHPLALLIIFLLGLVVLRTIAVVDRRSMKQSIPQIVWPFSLFWIWGLVVGISKNYPLDIMLTSHIINFVILIPIFVVMNYVLIDHKYWKLSIAVFFGVGAYIALFGSAEFSIPGFASLIPGFMAGPSEYIDVLGFHRAEFAFWGHASAIFISFLALPFVLALFRWHSSFSARIILIILSLVIIYGLYIAGWRSMWATVVILFFLLAIMKRSGKAVFLVIAMLAIIYVLLPPEARNRFETFTSAVGGEVEQTDSSSMRRELLANQALTRALENPLGLGWTASGWVHNDFIQLAADTGMLSVTIFILWYLNTLIRLGWLCWNTSDDLRLALFGSFFVVGVLFFTQPMYVQTQTIAPIWFVWAMADISLRQKGALISAPDPA